VTDDFVGDASGAMTADSGLGDLGSDLLAGVRDLARHTGVSVGGFADSPQGGVETIDGEVTPAVRTRSRRPSNLLQLRALALVVAREELRDHEGAPVMFLGHPITIAEAVLRSWFASRDFRKQEAAMALAFGRAPQKVELVGTDTEAEEARQLSEDERINRLAAIYDAARARRDRAAGAGPGPAAAGSVAP